jgi:hypothetical protein
MGPSAEIKTASFWVHPANEHLQFFSRKAALSLLKGVFARNLSK